MTEPAWASRVKTAAAVVFLVLVGFLLLVFVFVLLSEISVLAAQIGTWVFFAAALVGLVFLVRFLVRRSRAR